MAFICEVISTKALKKVFWVVGVIGGALWVGRSTAMAMSTVVTEGSNYWCSTWPKLKTLL